VTKAVGAEEVMITGIEPDVPVREWKKAFRSIVELESVKALLIP
jgi:hypothetical protein